MLCCFVFVSCSWGGWGAWGGEGWAGSFPLLVSGALEPTADDELSLTGLDHELLPNCRGLTAEPETGGGSALGFHGETAMSGWEREAGGWGRRRAAQEALVRWSQRPNDKEGARTPRKLGLGG